MSFPYYQSHEGITGMSDSHRKWARLHVPEDLSGQRVLDIGCNEGLLSSWCAANGAEHVIGIDFDAPRINFARKTYGAENLEFRCQTWEHLPEGPFGLVLWTSAMHYEPDPKSVLRNILQRLTPDGLLILECGVIFEPGKEMITQPRHSDTTFYPTETFLKEVLLEDFAFRDVAHPEKTPGDAVARVVYHCRRRQPTVMFVIGPSGIGKSDFVTRHLGRVADKTMKMDAVLSRIGYAEFAHSGLQKAIKANYNGDSLGVLYQLVQSDEYIKEFLTWIGQLCADSDEFVVIEGALKFETVQLFSEMFPNRRVWISSKIG